MAVTVLDPIDFTNNEIQNVKAQSLASDPTGIEAKFIYNSTSKVWKFYNGSAWIALGTLDQITTAAADLALGSHKITGMSDGSASSDAATKGQMDAAISAIASGISWKDSVVAAATTNGTLATAYVTGQTVGGVVVALGDRILLTGQTAGADNGIRVVANSGAPARAADSDTAADVQGTFVPVDGGTSAGKIFYLATDAVTLDTTALVWTEFTGATYVGGAGLVLTGTSFAVGAGTGITVNADDVAIDTSVVVRKYAVDVGDGSSTSITITHNLGTKDVTVELFDLTTPFSRQICEIQHTTTNTITLVFTIAPTAAKYRVVVHG